jgi:hypothetical protein
MILIPNFLYSSFGFSDLVMRFRSSREGEIEERSKRWREKIEEAGEETRKRRVVKEE